MRALTRRSVLLGAGGLLLGTGLAGCSRAPARTPSSQPTSSGPPVVDEPTIYEVD